MTVRRNSLPLSLAAFAFAVFPLTAPASAQVAPSFVTHGKPLTIGIGLSDYDLDWGQGNRMTGVSFNVDYRIWHQFSIDAEAHFIDFDRPEQLPRQEQNTFGGGVLYRTRRQPFGLQPYAKFLVDAGVEHFYYRQDPWLSTDRDIVFAPGGGLEVPLTHHLDVRVDYEYQMWRRFLNSPHYLTPQGFTFSAEWKWRANRRTVIHPHNQ